MTETTTIQITKEQREQLEARKSYDDEPYKSVIARLLEQDEGDITELVHDLRERWETDYDTVLEVLNEGPNSDGVSFDDVKAACRAALRDELPDEVLR